MNYVYRAFSDHLHYLNKPKYSALFLKYRELKRETHGAADPVFVGLIPWIYAGILYEFNSRQYSRPKLSLNIQWHHITWEECYEEAELKHKGIMRGYTPYPGVNVERITLEPAIYYMFDERRAMFAEEIPNQSIIMAVQIREVELKGE